LGFLKEGRVVAAPYSLLKDGVAVPAEVLGAHCASHLEMVFIKPIQIGVNMQAEGKIR